MKPLDRLRKKMIPSGEKTIAVASLRSSARLLRKWAETHIAEGNLGKAMTNLAEAADREARAEDILKHLEGRE